MTFSVKVDDPINVNSIENVVIKTGDIPPTCTAAVNSDPRCVSIPVPFLDQPNLSMTKASTGGDPFDEIGDIVTYEYVVTNTGNVAVANITVSDDKIPTVNCPSPASNSLAVGASITCTGSYTIIAADVSAGQVVNVANPSATPPPNTSIPPMEFPPIVTVPLDPKPKISVVKTATAPTVNLGINTSITDLDDTITYTLVTKNTGNVILNSVTISDTLVDMSTAVCAATSNGDVWANDNSDTLDIGESVSCSVDYVLIQTDIDAGKRENTVTVQGTPPTGPPIEGQSTVITPLQQKTSIELLKSATVIQDDDGSSSVTVGDTVDYTFTVKNTGNVTLTNVDVTDETAGLGLTIACPSGANPILSLTAGATEICTATYTLNAADVAGTGNAVINAGTGEFEIANDAKVVGIPPVNSGLTPPTSTSSALATAQVSAAISLEKSAGAITDADVDGKDSVGDTVTYSYLVKNTGTSILTGVTVTEDAANFSGTGTDPIPSGGLTTLNPGDSTTFTATYTLTQMDIDSGKLNNTAEATGTPPPGLEDPKSKSSVVVPITASPDFLVVKDSNSVPVKVGDTLDYTFTVANTGNVSLLTVTLVDAKCATQIALDSESITPDTILEVDEVQVYSCTSVPTTQAEVDAGKVDNTVTGTVTPPPGVPPVPPKDGDKTVPMVRTPDFTVIKDSNSVPVNVGDTLDYTFTVTNTGNVSLLTVTLVDAKCATPIALDSETKTADTILEVNEVQVYSCTSVPTTQAEVDAGKVDNTVTGTVTPPPGVPPVPPKDGDKTVPVVRTPDFTVVKDTNSLPIKVGDTLDYTFTVVNTGNVSLSSVTVVDVKCAATPILTSGDTNLDGRLNIDETFIYSCTSIPVTQSEVDAGKVDNTVRVTVVPPTGVPPVDPKDADKSVPLTPTPLISTTKGSSLNKGSDGVISVGDLVTYTYVVENTGNVTLTSVTITETQADFTGTGVLPVPGWQSNSGASAQGTLVVGEKATFSATYALTAADIAAGKLDNRVVGKGTPPNQPNGDPSTPVTDKSDSSNQNDPNETNIPNDPNGDDKTGTLLSSASISIIKSMTGIVDTVADGITGAGDSISYSFLVTNTGNLDLNPISVTDAKVANIICQSTSLAIGDSTSCIGDRYTITQQDVTDGGVENTAIATGTPKNADGSDGIPVTDKSDAGTNPDGSPVDTPTTEETPSPVGKIPNDPNDPTDDPTTVLLTPSPKIALVKQGKVNGTGIAGETISYTFTVTNVGNVPLTNVTITDDLPGMVVTGSISSLAVGQVDSTSIKGAYVIQSTDVTVGSVTNQATVSGKGPKGTTVTDKSDNTSVFEDDPTVTLLNPPVVVDDKRTYIPGQSKTLNILDNDGQAIPIVASSLRFTTTGTPNATLSGDGKTLTVPGEGEWVMGENGEVTFTPEQGYLGSNPTPPTYTGVSADGQVSNEARIILQGALPPSNEPIPTLSEWALMMLILLLGFVGYRQASLKRGVRF
ncbi:MAG: IPTL-CTERM sorting domain-containing protein [Cocleimonas sp.]